MSLNLTQFIGQSALIVSLVTGIFGVFFGLYIALARPTVLSKQFTMLRTCGVILLTTIAVACGMLVFCLLTDDFSLLYVVEHSSSQMQTPYKLAAFYSGQAGSLLIWSLVIAIGLFLQNFSKQSSKDALTHTVLSVILVLFLIPLVWLDSPFASSRGDFDEGIGLNPLLVDPTMLIHPPMRIPPQGPQGFGSRVGSIRLVVVVILMDYDDKIPPPLCFKVPAHRWIQFW